MHERWLTVWRWCYAGSELCHCDGGVVEFHGSRGVPLGVVEAVLCIVDFLPVISQIS